MATAFYEHSISADNFHSQEHIMLSTPQIHTHTRRSPQANHGNISGHAKGTGPGTHGCSVIPGWPLYMVTTAAAAAEPGKLLVRKLPPLLALPLAVNLMGSCPADSPRAQAGCATLREKAAAAKCGSLWSLLLSPLNLQEQEAQHSGPSQTLA